MRVEGVGAARIPSYWPLVEGWVANAVKCAAHVWTAADVRKRLADETMQLWIVWSGSKPVGVMVTEIYQTVSGKTCAVPVVGGDLEHIDAIDTIEAWARSNGCVRMQGEGRLGWARALKSRGYRALTMQVEKVL